MQTDFFRKAVVLGLVSAIGPFAIDMYLPALPSIGQSLGAGMGSVQTGFFDPLPLLHRSVNRLLRRIR